MRIDYDALKFNDADNGYLDLNGCSWMITSFDGWDGPSIRQNLQQATSRHGGSLANSLLAPRAMTLAGVVKAPTEALFWQSWNLLSNQFANLFAEKNIVVYEDSPKRMGVRLAGQVRKEMVGMSSFTFEVPLLATDPLKYAINPVTTSLAAGASRAIANEGSFVTERVLITTTGGGQVRVYNQQWGDAGVATQQPVVSGTVFDSFRRTVEQGGQSVYSALAAGSVWWGLRPGNNTVVNGPTPITVQHYPAWL